MAGVSNAPLSSASDCLSGCISFNTTCTVDLMYCACRYGFKIVGWRTSDSDLQWRGRTTQPSMLTYSTQPPQPRSTPNIGPWPSRPQLSIDHQALCLLRSSTMPVWDFSGPPPPTAASQRPTSNSLRSLPALISLWVLRRVPAHHPSDRQPLSLTWPLAKVTGSPDCAHARLVVPLFQVYSCRLHRARPCPRRVCSSRTSLTLNDPRRLELTELSMSIMLTVVM